MAQVIGIWSTVVKPDEPVIIDAPAAIRILNVSLGDEVADENGRSVVKLTYESLNIPNDEIDSDEEKDDDEDVLVTTTPICTLTAGKTETVTIDLVLEGESAYKLEVSGKNTVYLSGNYIDQDFDREPPSDDEFDSDDEEAGYRLEDVSSDVEMDINELDGVDTDTSRFEEVEEPAPTKGQKRVRDTEEAKADEEKPSKKSKKQKGDAEGKPEVKKDEKKEDKEEKKEEKKEKKKGKKDTEAPKAEAATTFNTPGGVIVKEVKVGTGPAAKKGHTVSMRYIGRLQNGKIFDQNVKGKPFVFHLGQREVIQGWDEGIAGMQVGGERVLKIPPGLAYGKKGTDGIPGNSTLTFEVKLLQIK